MNTFRSYKGRSIMPGQKVKVYRNLRENKFSIADYDTGLVLGHADSVTVLKADFKVRQSGREKVLNTKQKNVHAWVEGTFVTCNTLSNGQLRQAFYNPYETDQFIDIETSEPLEQAERVQLQSSKIYYHNVG